MEFQSSLVLSDEIKQSMEKMSRTQTRFDVSRSSGKIRKPLSERHSAFWGYVQKHQDSQLFACRSGAGIAMVFCPADHTGIWAGMIVKGSLGKRTQGILERIAKDKGLI